MKKNIIILLLILISNVCLSQNLSKTDFLEDLEFLKKTLPLKHTNLFNKITPEQFDRKVDQISMRANGLDENRFIVELFILTKSIGDEHTFTEVKFTQVLPIQFRIFKEGLFVVAIDSANAAFLNSKLERINGYPVEEVLARFRQIIQDESPSYFEDRLLQHLSNPVLLNGLELIGNDSTATFTLKKQDGQIQQIKLKSMPGGEVAKLTLKYSGENLLSQKRIATHYWSEYLANQKILYFNYNDCREEPSLPFATFNDELFKLIAEKHPQQIVLDLRENSGGNSGILRPFIEQLKTSYLNQRNKLFVLIGKHTFSSAVMNAVELKRTTQAILIGEATSGNINHYGEVRGFRLPKSNIIIAYSTKYWENWKGKKGPLKPDIEVKYSIKNYREGKDEAMMAVNK